MGNKRAAGTRDRVIAHLRAVGEITDSSGMASTVLAEAVGYPGSSAAFAQLLSGMQRADLIEREIRGKRTYRIGLAGSAAAHGSPAAGRQARTPALAAAVRRRSFGSGGEPSPPRSAAGFDYDELARHLLVEVVQRLAAPAEDPAPGTGAEPGHGRLRPAPGDVGLTATLASLEQKLATIQSRQRRLTAENARLREQLHAAQLSLAQAQERAWPGQLDSAEVRLLERLLFPLREQAGRREEAGTG